MEEGKIRVGKGEGEGKGKEKQEQAAFLPPCLDGVAGRAGGGATLGGCRSTCSRRPVETVGGVG